MLFDQLGLKTAFSVARRVQIELAIFGLQGFAGVAITAVGAVGVLALEKRRQAHAAPKVGNIKHRETTQAASAQQVLLEMLF